MINLKKNDEIAAIAKVEMDKEVAEEDSEENAEGTGIVADNQENNTEPQAEKENPAGENENSDSEE
jgi:DNA gyrase subunit A